MFSLHQIGLVLLVAWFGARLPLPHLPTRRRKPVLGAILALTVVVLSLYILALLVDMTISGAPDAGSRPLAVACWRCRCWRCPATCWPTTWKPGRILWRAGWPSAAALSGRRFCAGRAA